MNKIMKSSLGNLILKRPELKELMYNIIKTLPKSVHHILIECYGLETGKLGDYKYICKKYNIKLTLLNSLHKYVKHEFTKSFNKAYIITKTGNKMLLINVALQNKSYFYYYAFQKYLTEETSIKGLTEFYHIRATWLQNIIKRLEIVMNTYETIFPMTTQIKKDNIKL